ncbi:hypothetical protein D3C81_1206260 [compost metagenome]
MGRHVRVLLWRQIPRHQPAYESQGVFQSTERAEKSDKHLLTCMCVIGTVSVSRLGFGLYSHITSSKYRFVIEPQALRFVHGHLGGQDIG